MDSNQNGILIEQFLGRLDIVGPIEDAIKQLNSIKDKHPGAKLVYANKYNTNPCSCLAFDIIKMRPETIYEREIRLEKEACKEIVERSQYELLKKKFEATDAQSN